MKAFKITLFVISACFLVGLIPAAAAIYYVDATDGKDTYDGLSQKTPFKTLSKINSMDFKAGDIIKLKCGEIWRESLNVPSSGSSEKPITFTQYGSGKNPVITSTENFNSWINEGDNIYSGSLSGYLNHYGAIDSSGLRSNRYWHSEMQDSRFNPPSSINQPVFSELKKNMSPDFFWSPRNGVDGKSKFYYRTSGGSPGSMEIGSRPYWIVIQGKDNIIIDGIDCTGPTGSDGDLSSSDTHGIYVKDSANINFRNLRLTHSNKTGIKIAGQGSKNSKIENVTIEDCLAGVVYAAAGSFHLISRARIINIGTVIPDRGDRAFIGMSGTNNVTIEDSYLDRRIWLNTDSKCDPSGISFVSTSHGQGSNNGIVRRCYIRDPGESGIQVATGNNFEIYNNIIEGWGLRPHGKTTSKHRFNGITVGGGSKTEFPDTPQNVKILNNLFVNGNYQEGDHAAIRVRNYYVRNLKIKNNIFINNSSPYDLYIEGKTTEGWEISNNCIYRTNGNIIWEFSSIHSHSDIDKFNAKRSWAKGNISVNPNLNNDFTFKASSPESVRLKGDVLAEAEYGVALHPDYIWSPVITPKTIERKTFFSMGPYEYTDADTGGNPTSKLSAPKNLRKTQ